ncbi:MAG: hypothetical protein ACO1RX_17925 [Candidatus Sericytochromatia bacterium]
MSFSAFNVGSQMMSFTGNTIPQQRFGSKPVAGGSFAPNTLEAAFSLRSSLDYQFEKAFIDKYRALMQNRLNELVKKLQEAYTDLLNVSMAQQIGEGADESLRADVRLDGQDGGTSAQLLEGAMGANGFEDLGIHPGATQTSVNYTAPGAGNSGTNIWRAPGLQADELSAGGAYADDGIGGYGRNIGGVGDVQFRALNEYTTAAGNVSGDLHITMRVEDDPPIPEDTNVALDLLNSVTSAILGGPPDPTYFNQKVEQHSTTYKTGGFWSTVNYLYNFAPREMKYTYAVGYTVNTDEAGNDEYLIDGELVNNLDIPPGPQGYLQKDQRIKWASFDPTEGYQQERSGTSNLYPTVINREKAWLDGYDVSGGGERAIWNNTPTAADGRVYVVDGLIFQSGTYIFNGTFVNSTGGIGTTISGTTNIGGVIVQDSALNNGTLVSLLESNIEMGSTFRYKVDMTHSEYDSEGRVVDNFQEPDSGTDLEIFNRGANRSSVFYNHYEVETRTVEFNSTRADLDELTPIATDEDLTDDAIGKIYAYGDIKRSHSIDASKNYDLVASNPADPNSAKEITRSSGNINGSFNGEFVQSQHKIQSVNGQNVVGNDEKQASPILGNFEIGQYEGMMRSYQMNRNIVEYIPPSQMEINAANAVPTDWYQSELLVTSANDPADPADGKIWFPFVEDTLYSRKPENATAGDSRSGYGRLGAPRQLIQARNTFQLAQDELMTLQPAADWVSDALGIKRPTYEKKDFNINIDLTGIHYDDTTNPPEVPKLFVNGREVLLAPASGPTPLNAGTPNVVDVGYQVNLKDVLQVGYNTISLQTSDGAFHNILGDANYNEGIRITAGTNTDPGVDGTINAKIITGYDNTEAVTYAPDMSRPGMQKVQSRWQTRVIPTTAEQDGGNNLVKLASDPNFTGSSYKVANTFIEMIIDMLNQEKYRDIFRLGLMSNLNKVAVNGQANLPNGASLQGALSVYFDQNLQKVVVFQDKLIAGS